MIEGFVVWCQGGPADGFTYQTLIEPPDEIEVAPTPMPHGFVRVMDWGDAAYRYVRQRDVEQFDWERIYYPAGVTGAQLSDAMGNGRG